jgi:oxygen-independent coproporphyrinogen III oxidase
MNNSRVRVRSAAEIAGSGSFEEAQSDGRYQGYTYSYPHKTSYTWFDTPKPLSQIWANQNLASSFLYVHIPFCEMRCGFCNLFTTTDPSEVRESKFVVALERQAHIVRSSLGESFRVTSGAIGGGTPTILSAANLQRVFTMMQTTYGVDLQRATFSVETSPDTADDEKVAILADNKVHRVSIGIQSWFSDELRAMGRPQDIDRAHAAVQRLRNSGIPIVNIDLIYGVDGQTSESMAANIVETLRHEPDEVFLYPLYVRPLTGLGRNSKRSWDDDRLALYRVGRDALLEAGFRQVSMRRFERPTIESMGEHRREEPEADYDCQRDPMIGLGPGARSYSASTHYSTDWAVGRDAVRSIIDNYIDASNEYHAHAHYGVELTSDDRQRRFVLQGLLHRTGLDVNQFVTAFGVSPLDVFAQLRELLDIGLAKLNDDSMLRLSDRGYEFSDVIGPWFYSPFVRDRMTSFDMH